jgi:hypothetical protein
MGNTLFCHISYISVLYIYVVDPSEEEIRGTATNQLERLRAMEGVSKAALAFYEKATEEQKKMATDFFKSMDIDGDGTITLEEFEKAFKDKGFSKDKVTDFFHKLDANGNGTLDFEEVLAFYWICERSRCDGCGVPMYGIHFSCTECHSGKDSNGGSGFNLCSDCYLVAKVSHKHAALVEKDMLTVSENFPLIQ